MSNPRDSPLTTEGADAVLIEPSERDSYKVSYGSAAPPTRPHSREKNRATSPGVNGTASRHGGITHKTQIQLTRRSGTGRSGWKLKYQDFLPAKADRGDQPEAQFKSLVDRANEWLSRNLDVSVKTCETVTWIDHDVTRLGDNEQMVLCKRITENAKTYQLLGLRVPWVDSPQGYMVSRDYHHFIYCIWLWLTARPRSRAQCICYSDVIPDQNDTMPDLVTKANRKIQQHLLTGQVFTVETVPVPIVNGNVDSDITWWSKNANEDSPYAFCLRLYHDKNTAGHRALIGMQDFVPGKKDDCYESFDELSDHANTWLKDQDVIVTNMQSVMVQDDGGVYEARDRSCFYTIPGIDNWETAEYLRILRLSYLQPAADAVSDIPIIYPFTYEIFSPELVALRDGQGRNRLERLKEISSRINEFLKSPGAEIISVETVMYPMQLYPDDIAQLSPNDMQFVFSIRLFLTDQVEENDDQLQCVEVRRSSGSRRQKESSPGQPPGPIFLKSVVNKNYKYRWIIFAVSGITCMTIIVVISIIYSNQ